MQRHTHHLQFSCLVCLPLHSHAIRKVIDLRGSNFFHCSYGILRGGGVVFEKGVYQKLCVDGHKNVFEER